jgi:hypothetical protein
MKKLFALVFVFVFQSVQAFVPVQDLATVEEFNQLLQTSKIPVIVLFDGKLFCKECPDALGSLKRSAASFSSDRVKIARIDAQVNSSLKQYVIDYPTTRAFFLGQPTKEYFTGAMSTIFVYDFIEEVIRNNHFCSSNLCASDSPDILGSWTDGCRDFPEMLSGPRSAIKVWTFQVEDKLTTKTTWWKGLQCQGNHDREFVIPGDYEFIDSDWDGFHKINLREGSIRYFQIVQRQGNQLYFGINWALEAKSRPIEIDVLKPYLSVTPLTEKY